MARISLLLAFAGLLMLLAAAAACTEGATVNPHSAGDLAAGPPAAAAAGEY
jgi:hypothetical protein